MDKSIQTLEKELIKAKKLRNARIMEAYQKASREDPDKPKSRIYTEIGAIEGLTSQRVRLIIINAIKS